MHDASQQKADEPSIDVQLLKKLGNTNGPSGSLCQEARNIGGNTNRQRQQSAPVETTTAVGVTPGRVIELERFQRAATDEIVIRNHHTANRAKQRATARDVDNARTGTFRNEEGTRSFSYTSMVIEPADGRVPAITPEARARRRPGDQGSFGVGPWDKVQDFSLYDRCITRGMVGSWMPAVYGNGARIIQTPDSVVIGYEMVHDTRVIPLDGRKHLSPAIKQLMGDSRAHYEGDTLVIESSNFTDRTNIGGARHSESMKVTERFTRIDPEMIDWEIHVEDPATFTAPWTMRLTVTRQPGYEIYEYGCHEGNNAMRNALSAERAYDKAVAEAIAKGLPPPERVFEQVNGPDRAR